MNQQCEYNSAKKACFHYTESWGIFRRYWKSSFQGGSSAWLVKWCRLLVVFSATGNFDDYYTSFSMWPELCDWLVNWFKIPVTQLES